MKTLFHQFCSSSLNTSMLKDIDQARFSQAKGKYPQFNTYKFYVDIIHNSELSCESLTWSKSKEPHTFLQF